MWAQARHRPAPGVRQPPAGAARRVGYWSLKMVIEALTANLAAVRVRMERAAERSRRDPAGILLLAVTKIFPAEAIQEAYALGLLEFGENYVQEFERKVPSLSGLAGARFHLIGHRSEERRVGKECR